MTGPTPASKPPNPAKAFALCSVYILLSMALIHLNKYLMGEGRFPYAMTLTSFHMATSLVMCLTLYLVKPAMFPSMDQQRQQQQQQSESPGGMTMRRMIKTFVPIGIFFATTLYCSNQAYKFCGVAFLQFMKETNVASVFLLSCAVGLQALTRTKLVVIVWIVVGAGLCIAGDLHFSFVGFVFQAISCLTECSRHVLGEWVLSGLRLDPLTYTMMSAPACLALLLVGNIFTWDPAIIPSALRWWHVLLPNSAIAFALNVTVALVIKECSAIGFVLTGIVKDILIVVVSCIMFGDSLRPMQVASFIVTIVGIFAWSYMKVYPEDSTVRSINRLLGQKPTACSDETSLIPGKRV